MSTVEEPTHAAMSNDIDKLVTALAKAQGQFQTIGKDKTAKIQTKAGGSYAYDYADLATILAAVRKPLADNELAIMQPVTLNGDVMVTTILAHASGQWISGRLPMPVSDKNDPRAVASAITYARRYGLLALIGVAPAEEDDDGDAAKGNDTHSTPAAAAVIPPRGTRENAASPTAGGIGHLGTLITKVEEASIPSGKMAGKPKWIIHTQDGVKASTIVATVASKAQMCQASGTRVRLELKKTQWGQDLVGIFEVPASSSAPMLPEIQLRGHEHSHPVTEEEIPF